MSSIWTPSGEHQPERRARDRGRPGPTRRRRRRRDQPRSSSRRCSGPGPSWPSIPVADIVANHAVGLRQLAVMHLIPDPGPDGTPTEPRPRQAGLAIDALGALVDGLGDRLGPHAEALREAVTQLRLAFVELSAPSDSLAMTAHDVADRAVRARSATPRPRPSSPTTARSTGCASPGSTPAPASPRCSATTATGAGCSPRRPAGAATRRAYRDGTLVLETEWDTPEGTVRVIDCMPVRDQSVDLVRVVEGVRGRGADAMDFVVRFDYGSIVPWVHADDGHHPRSSPGPTALCLTTPVRVEGARLPPHRRVHRRARATGCRSCSPATRRTRSRRRASTPTRPSTAPTRAGRSGRAQSTYDGDWARRGAALAHHPEGAHLRAHRRDRRRAHHVAARVDRRRAQLGLPLLLAARRHVHASTR